MERKERVKEKRRREGSERVGEEERKEEDKEMMGRGGQESRGRGE